MMNDEQDAFVAEALFLGQLDSPSETLLEALDGKNGDTLGFIGPVTAQDLRSDGLLEAFCRWRNENQFAYPTRFLATRESTKTWLEAALSGGKRILFKLLNISHELIGHIGLAWNVEKERLELDSVQRGISGSSGIMSAAVEWIEGYVQKEFNSSDLHLRVLGSNSNAVKFYSALGYSEYSSADCPVQEVIDGQDVIIKEVLITMVKDLENSQEVKAEILTAGPSIGYRERTYTADAVKSGWNNRNSDYIQALQRSFADFVGTEHALATSSCTGALHLALAALGLGPGDEVIVPAITWVASASAVAYTGATPVFVDVNQENWTLEPEAVKARLNPATKAIVAVHLYGFMADVRQLRDLADAHGLYLIEDAAPAIGATLAGRKAGTFGHFGCFSFQGAKLLVAGEGGMLVTDSPELFAKAVKLQEHGRKPGTFWIDELGYKYKMSNLTAALALGQLERVQPQIVKKRMIATWYREELINQEGLEFQQELPSSQSIHWMTSLRLTGSASGKRETLALHLRDLGIDTRPVFPNISKFAFWGEDSQQFKAADAIADDGINLPSGVRLTQADVRFVSKAIREYLGD